MLSQKKHPKVCISQSPGARLQQRSPSSALRRQLRIRLTVFRICFLIYSRLSQTNGTLLLLLTTLKDAGLPSVLCLVATVLNSELDNNTEYTFRFDNKIFS